MCDVTFPFLIQSLDFTSVAALLPSWLHHDSKICNDLLSSPFAAGLHRPWEIWRCTVNTPATFHLHDVKSFVRIQ